MYCDEEGIQEIATAYFKALGWMKWWIFRKVCNDGSWSRLGPGTSRTEVKAHYLLSSPAKLLWLVLDVLITINTTAFVLIILWRAGISESERPSIARQRLGNQISCINVWVTIKRVHATTHIQTDVSCTTEVSFSLQRINRTLRQGVLYSVSKRLS
jgi:hypothetical protein